MDSKKHEWWLAYPVDMIHEEKEEEKKNPKENNWAVIVKARK